MLLVLGGVLQVDAREGGRAGLRHVEVAGRGERVDASILGERDVAQLVLEISGRRQHHRARAARVTHDETRRCEERDRALRVRPQLRGLAGRERDRLARAVRGAVLRPVDQPSSAVAKPLEAHGPLAGRRARELSGLDRPALAGGRHRIGQTSARAEDERASARPRTEGEPGDLRVVVAHAHGLGSVDEVLDVPCRAREQHVGRSSHEERRVRRGRLPVLYRDEIDIAQRPVRRSRDDAVLERDERLSARRAGDRDRRTGDRDLIVLRRSERLVRPRRAVEMPETRLLLGAAEHPDVVGSGRPHPHEARAHAADLGREALAPRSAVVAPDTSLRCDRPYVARRRSPNGDEVVCGRGRRVLREARAIEMMDDAALARDPDVVVREHVNGAQVPLGLAARRERERRPAGAARAEDDSMVADREARAGLRRRNRPQEIPLRKRREPAERALTERRRERRRCRAIGRRRDPLGFFHRR